MELHSNATFHLWLKLLLVLPQRLAQCDSMLILDPMNRIICISATLLTGLLCLIRGSMKLHYSHHALHLQNYLVNAYLNLSEAAGFRM